MSSVTYKKQAGIHRIKGKVPIAGCNIPYTVSGILWPDDVEAYLAGLLIRPSLHICCGESRLGDVRLDLFQPDVDVRADASRLPFSEGQFASVLCDPPYSAKFQWNHDMLNEMVRVCNDRIIFQHWFIPANKQGRLKKSWVYRLESVTLVPSLSVYQDDMRPALFDKETGSYFVVEEVEGGSQFQLDLEACRVWQPRSYFGRTQIISVFERDFFG